MVEFMVNMLSSNLTEQLQFLAHARATGAMPPGAVIELGGEFYWACGCAA